MLIMCSILWTSALYSNIKFNLAQPHYIVLSNCIKLIHFPILNNLKILIHLQKTKAVYTDLFHQCLSASFWLEGHQCASILDYPSLTAVQFQGRGLLAILVFHPQSFYRRMTVYYFLPLQKSLICTYIIIVLVIISINNLYMNLVVGLKNVK